MGLPLEFFFVDLPDLRLEDLANVVALGLAVTFGLLGNKLFEPFGDSDGSRLTISMIVETALPLTRLYFTNHHDQSL